ncbi:hypothetical protein FHX05_000031 [Rhizobium sp. BK491]|nr:hypothetical protein [Rhizobium sp. BK491]
MRDDMKEHLLARHAASVAIREDEWYLSNADR